MTVASPPPSQEDDAELAARLTERLVSGIGAERREYTTEKLDIFVADVEVAVEQFDAQWMFHMEYGQEFPCLLYSDRPVPINLLVPLVWARGLRRPFPPDIYYLHRYILEDIVNLEEKIAFIHPKEALHFFKERLQEFLTTRFRARRSDISSSPGLQVRADTNTSGLRVHYSRAFFFDPTNILNAPTTPVLGWMQPGRYIFGASRPGEAAKFDFTAEYDIPPTNRVFLGV